MGKKKGRQSGHFGSKAKRAAFLCEWQSLAFEAQSHHRNSRRPREEEEEAAKARPKLQLHHLQHMLQERVQTDRHYERQQRLATSRPIAAQNTTPPPDDIIYQGNDDYYEKGLVALCVKSLAPILQEYIQQLGRDQVHSLLSVLPAKTLTALSVELTRHDLWKSDDMVYAVAHHYSMTRLSLNGDALSEQGMVKALLMRSTSHSILQERHVPDSWEEHVNDKDDDDCVKKDLVVQQWHRLDLREVPLSILEILLDNDKLASLTHLSIQGGVGMDRVLQKRLSALPCLRVFYFEQSEDISITGL